MTAKRTIDEKRLAKLARKWLVRDTIWSLATGEPTGSIALLYELAATLQEYVQMLVDAF